MTYEIEIAEKLEKRLNKLSNKDKARILEKIDSLSENSRPEDCRKLQSRRKPSLYRVRSGVFRIVYSIVDHILLLLVVDIDHRKDVYR